VVGLASIECNVNVYIAEHVSCLVRRAYSWVGYPSKVNTLHLEFSNKHVLKVAQRNRHEHRKVRNPSFMRQISANR